MRVQQSCCKCGSEKIAYLLEGRAWCASCRAGYNRPLSWEELKLVGLRKEDLGSGRRRSRGWNSDLFPGCNAKTVGWLDAVMESEEPVEQTLEGMAQAFAETFGAKVAEDLAFVREEELVLVSGKMFTTEGETYFLNTPLVNISWKSEDGDAGPPRGQGQFHPRLSDPQGLRRTLAHAMRFLTARLENTTYARALAEHSRRDGGYDAGLETYANRLLGCSADEVTIFCERGHAWTQARSCGVLGCPTCSRYHYLRKILGYEDDVVARLTAYREAREPVYLVSLSRSMPSLTDGEYARCLAARNRWIERLKLPGGWKAAGPRWDGDGWTYEARLVVHGPLDERLAKDVGYAEGWQVRAVPVDLADVEKAWHQVKMFVWTMPTFEENPSRYPEWLLLMRNRRKLDSWGDWRAMEWALTLTCTVLLPDGSECGSTDWTFLPPEMWAHAPTAGHGWGGYG